MKQISTSLFFGLILSTNRAQVQTAAVAELAVKETITRFGDGPKQNDITYLR